MRFQEHPFRYCDGQWQGETCGNQAGQIKGRRAGHLEGIAENSKETVKAVSKQYSFSRLPDGRVLDSSPMREGKFIHVFENGSWSVFEGTLGQWRDSKPITEDEARALTSPKPA